MKRFFLLTVITGAVAMTGKADTLATWSSAIGAQVTSASDPVLAVISVGEAKDPYCSTSECFFGQILTLADVGDVFTFNSSDANFATVTSLFKTGERVWQSGSSYPSLNASTGYFDPLNLSGDTITSIVTTITSGSFNAQSSHEGFFYTTVVNGTVGTPPTPTPEPSSWMMMAGGALLLTSGAWQRGRS